MPRKGEAVEREVGCIGCRSSGVRVPVSLFHTLITGSAELSEGCAKSKRGSPSYCLSCRLLAACSFTL